MAVRADIRGVQDALGSECVFEGEIALDDVSVGGESFTFPNAASFEVTLANGGAGIVASGSITAVARAQCVRCLCEFDLPVKGEIEAFYVEPGRDEDIPEEQEYEPITDGSVDLEPALMQALLVELPFAPVHADDCAGICPTCGADLNAETCGCATEEGASPFQALRGLLDGEGDAGAKASPAASEDEPPQER